MPKKVVIIIFTTLTLIIFLKFVDSYNKKNITNSLKEFSPHNLQNKVEIWKSDYGLYEIKVESVSDYFFSLGYIQSQDRLWQLDYIRRRYYGELSEILGAGYSQQDKFFRTLSLPYFAKEFYSKLNQEEKNMFISYTNGINEYIKQNWQNLPFEFNHLNYKPKLWSAEESVCLFLGHYIQTNKLINNQLFTQLGNAIDEVGSTNKESLLLPSSDSLGKYETQLSNKLIERKKEKVQHLGDFINFLSANGLNCLDRPAFEHNIYSEDSVNKTNSHLFSYIKYNNLTFLNQFYPVVFSLQNSNNFQFSVIGFPLPLISIWDNNNFEQVFNLNHSINKQVEKNITNQEESYKSASKKNKPLKNIIGTKKAVPIHIRSVFELFTFSSKKEAEKEVKFSVDTLKIANSTPIQFYSRKLKSKDSFKDSFIISDYIEKHGDKTNEFSNLMVFSLDSMFFKQTQTILESYLNLLKNFKQSLPPNKKTEESYNQNNSSNFNDLDDYLDFDLLTKKELEANLKSITHPISKDIQLLQNIKVNGLDIELLKLLNGATKGYPINNTQEVYLSLLLHKIDKKIIRYLKVKNPNLEVFKYWEQYHISLFKTIFLSIFKKNLVKNLDKMAYFKDNRKYLFLDNTHPQIGNNLLLCFLNTNKDYLREEPSKVYEIQLAFFNAFKTTVESLENPKLSILKQTKLDVTITHPLSKDNFLANSLNFQIYNIGNIGSIYPVYTKQIKGKSNVFGQAVRLIYDYNTKQILYIFFGGTSSNFVELNYNNNLIQWEKGGYLSYFLNSNFYGNNDNLVFRLLPK